MTDRSKPTDLKEEDLDTAHGGFEAWPAKWKGFSLHGNGNTAMTAAVAGITADQTTIIGGFKSMSGMDSETGAKDPKSIVADIFNEPHD